MNWAEQGAWCFKRTNIHPFRPPRFDAQPYRFAILGEVADVW